ncbi:MAG: dockerin type I repeat-containing protein, partial [Ruminococcus sp.]|nr:dockerin type I repeat-containing protein [Ruminococcus sp.]
AAKGHTFGSPTYTWSKDGKSCTASRKCSVCSTAETEKATITSKVKTPATATAMGVTTYTATFKNTAFKTQTKDVTDIPKVTGRIPGDANDDKQVNIMDVLVIRQHLAGWNVSINLSNANVNGDKTVNIQDVLLIRQNLAGWNVALV